MKIIENEQCKILKLAKTIYDTVNIIKKIGEIMKKRGGNSRIVRINDEILREVAIIIRSELKDPRTSNLISVINVDTTSDLKYCKIYVSVLGDEKTKQEALQGLKNASGFIRKQLATRINLRNTPELKFVLDDSLEYSIKMNTLIKEATKDLTEERDDEDDESESE